LTCSCQICQFHQSIEPYSTMADPSNAAVTVDTYSFPPGSKGVNTVVCGAIMLLSTRRSFIDPGATGLHSRLLAGRPTAIRYSGIAQDVAFYFLFGAHSVEAAVFAYQKLRKHGIKAFSLVWWKWMLTVFAGGVFATKHFDEVVKEKEKLIKSA